jgi:hypothetical protein
MAITDVEILHTCVWCKGFIESDDLGTTQVETLDGRTDVYFQHRGECPQ